MSRKPGVLLSLVATVAGVAGVAQAADEALYFSDLPVVASVSRLPQRQSDAPTSVTVLDREMIKASGARDLNDVFRLVPGFQTFPSNTDSARVTYHGLTDEDYSPRVQVLVDGRSLHSPLFRNGTNWATLPVAIEDIERIEIVRGSNAVSYGSNAFLGVINIITVDPALARGFSLSTNYGNQGVRDYTLRSGGKLGDVGDFRFTYQSKADSGLTDRFDWIDSNRSQLLDFRADVVLNDSDILQFGAGHVEAVSPQGRLARSGNVLTGGSSPGWPIHDYTQSSDYLQLLWRRAYGTDSDLQVRYAFIADRASDRYISNDSGYLYDTDEFGDRGMRNEIEILHKFSPFAGGRVSWGGSWRHDETRSATMLAGLGAVHRDVARLFGNLEWKPLNRFTGNLGLSVEDDSLGGVHASPRLSGNFHLMPENTVRLGYSRAYRTGSVADYRARAVITPFARADGSAFLPGEQSAAASYLFAGNPGMAAERMDTWEIGYLGDWRAWRMSLDVRWFNEKIPNRLLQVFTDPDSTMAVQEVSIRGIEYLWKWQPFDVTRLMLGQSFVHIDSSFLADALGGVLSGSSGDTLRNLDQLAEYSAPHRTTSLLLMQQLPFGVQFSLAGYWVDRMKWTRNSWADKYQRLDARLGYPFRVFGQRGELSYTVQSLNGDHGEFKSYGQPSDRVVGRRQWLGLRLDF